MAPRDALAGSVTESKLMNTDVFNLFNRDTNDITYYYESRLPGELLKA